MGRIDSWGAPAVSNDFWGWDFASMSIDVCYATKEYTASKSEPGIAMNRG